MSIKKHLLNQLAVIIELVCALFSFILFKCMKFLISVMFKQAARKKQENANFWTVMNGEMIDKPLRLPFLLVRGPRWNTHAVIAMTVVDIRRTLGVRIDTAHASAKPWTIVVTGDNSVTWAIGSLNSNIPYPYALEEGWIRVEVPEGKYNLALRYYNIMENAFLPEVEVDGKLEVEKRFVDSRTNEFYKQMILRKTAFYSMLQFYVYSMIRLKKYLPSRLVKSEYLPVGNPETEFIYGHLENGQKLEIDVDPKLFDFYDLYYNIYDRASFPLLWGQVKEKSSTIESIGEKGFYLIRICQRELGLGYQESMVNVKVS